MPLLPMPYTCLILVTEYGGFVRAQFGIINILLKPKELLLQLQEVKFIPSFAHHSTKELHSVFLCVLFLMHNARNHNLMARTRAETRCIKSKIKDNVKI